MEVEVDAVALLVEARRKVEGVGQVVIRGLRLVVLGVDPEPALLSAPSRGYG